MQNPTHILALDKIYNVYSVSCNRDFPTTSLIIGNLFVRYKTDIFSPHNLLFRGLQHRAWVLCRSFRPTLSFFCGMFCAVLPEAMLLAIPLMHFPHRLYVPTLEKWNEMKRNKKNEGQRITANWSSDKWCVLWRIEHFLRITWKIADHFVDNWEINWFSKAWPSWSNQRIIVFDSQFPARTNSTQL